MSEYVEVTRRGFGSRGKDSIGGALFGMLLVVVGVILLFWNEGRAVKRYKDLKEGAGAVVSVSSDQIDPETEGKLVHLTGETRIGAPLADPEFGISLPAVKLIRKAEIYQWVEIVKSETREKTGGSSEVIKTYRYEKQWRDSPVDSSQFKVSGDHQNPTEMKVRSTTFTADQVTLGAFTLPPFLVAQIGGGLPLAIDSLENAAAPVKTTGKLAKGGVYFGASPDAPAVGDQRISFTQVPTGPVSVVAQQSQATLVPYVTKTGGNVELLESGIVSAADMFQRAQDRAKMITWAIRIGGFFLLGLAFSMILRPIAVLASILPFLGRLVGTGTGIVAFLLGGILWSLTVSFAWIFYRPVLGIAILVVTVFLIVLLVKRLRRPAAAPPLMAGPPPLA